MNFTFLAYFETKKVHFKGEIAMFADFQVLSLLHFAKLGMPIPRRFSFLGDSGDRGSSYIPTFGTCLNILFATNIDLQVRIEIS